MRNKLIVLLFLLFAPFCLLSQGKKKTIRDSVPYTLFNDKLVLYTDIGYASAPFSIKYDFGPEVKRLRYRNNFRTILGLGVTYKWFALRLGFPLPGDVRPVSRYGKTSPFNLGLDFTIKKTFLDIELRRYQGYVIKNAKKWNDTLDDLHPNDIRKNTTALSLSLNAWYFHNKYYKMSALRGKTGHYEGIVKTWYIKSTFNIFGIGNESSSIVPIELIDSTNTKTGANILSSIDFGAIPGYAFVNKINNWQFSIMAGFGAVIQAKHYANDNVNRTFLGLAPRYDIKLIGGYTVPRYFIFLVTDFDNKSIRFTDLYYRQSFYYVKIVGGVRLDAKKREKPKE